MADDRGWEVSVGQNRESFSFGFGLPVVVVPLFLQALGLRAQVLAKRQIPAASGRCASQHPRPPDERTAPGSSEGGGHGAVRRDGRGLGARPPSSAARSGKPAP